jgi:hypothetical protein
MAEYEVKFCVIKTSDALKYLTKSELTKLGVLFAKIDAGRKADGKSINNYYVCNTDEPYAQKIIQTILDGEDAKGEADG